MQPVDLHVLSAFLISFIILFLCNENCRPATPSSRNMSSSRALLPPRLHLSFPTIVRHPAQDVTLLRHLSACLFWYSSIRCVWWQRSGTNSLFNPLIIIRGINKFGWNDYTLNSAPLTSLWMYLFLSFFTPCCWVTKGVSSSASSSASALRAQRIH